MDTEVTSKTDNSVHVCVTDRHAIYVDDIRITDRETKWGFHNTLEEFFCDKESVEKECRRRGFTTAANRISR